MLVKEVMQPRVITARPEESLPDAALQMETLKIKRLPVVQGGQLVGLLSDGDIRRHLPALHEGLSPWDFACRAAGVKVREAMVQPVLTATPEEPLEQAVRVMLERRVGGLPVVGEGGQLAGILTLTDVLRAEAKAARLQWGLVEQHMTRTAVSTPAGAPASEAAAKLRITGLRVLPVLEEGRLVGVLHERDLSQVVERGKAGHGDTVMGGQFFLTGKTARDLMRPPGSYLLANAPLRSAITRMLEADVHGLPVIGADGELLGVITISDVLRAILNEWQEDRV